MNENTLFLVRDLEVALSFSKEYKAQIDALHNFVDKSDIKSAKISGDAGGSCLWCSDIRAIFGWDMCEEAIEAAKRARGQINARMDERTGGQPPDHL